MFTSGVRTFITNVAEGGEMNFGGFDIGGFASKFGQMNIDLNDFGSFGGGGGSSRRSGYTTRYSTQRPQVVGRSTRKAKKNPFAGYGKQSYDEIIKMCREQGCLFEDPEFPAEDSSIFFSKSPPRPFEWKRPSEICSDPQYVSSGASRFDVQQGELGDCWLLAAVASLTCNPKLLNRIILPDQNFGEGSYYGVFRFMFWHQGDWIEIVVDDKLPTYNDRLVFMHSTDRNEFWSALLEKAYAKLNGSYESLKGGSTSEAMEDFTGGVTESVEMKDPNKCPENLLNIMLKADARGSLMGCSIDADPNQLEAQLSNGLVMGHAYSVTSVKLAEIQTPKVSGKIPLVRVRNPWGNEVEWKGAWSDSSAEWQYIPDEEKRNLGIVKDDDGEFWMSFEDWKNNFEKLEICNLGPDSLDEDDRNAGKIRWEATAEKGEWIPRVNAGGCRNFLETFATNPQYRVTLTDPDEDEDDLCTILIGVLQKDRRKKRKEGLDMLTIGYCIYKMKDDGSSSGPLDVRFFKYNASVGKSPSFINMREVCGRHKYPPGTYVIIPSTFEPNQAGEFLMRIFTEKPGTSSEMDEGTGIIENQWLHQEQSQAPEPYADPYANQQPLPLGFDHIDKTIYKPPPAPYSMPYGSGFPGAPATGYQPYPAGQGYAPYGAPPAAPTADPYTGAPGYQAMPSAPYDPYNQSAGYQQQPGFPHPAYNVGYQPSPYGSGSAGAGYQSGQYNPYPSQPGYGPPQGQYPTQQGYNTTPSYGMPSPYPSQPSYPYGQGEAMERAESSSTYMATPQPKKFHQIKNMQGPHMIPVLQGQQVFLPTQVALCASAPPGEGYPGVPPPPPQERRAPAPTPSAPKKEGPPVTEEDQAQGQALRESFKQTAGEDLEVDAYELKEILNAVFTREFQFDGFSVDVCRSMVAMNDGDCSGKLGFDEFKALWGDLRKWKAVFKQFDKDQSGKLSSYELRSALHASGFRLSNRSLSSIIMRYSNKSGEIEFDDFVLSAIRLKTMIASFKSMEIENKNIAAYDIDTFIQTTMYS